MSLTPYIALTDKAWFDFLASQATDGVVDEVNFWSPRSLQPLKRLTPGEPVFLRLKRPHYAIAGFGFYAHFAPLSLDDAWEYFRWKNGDPDQVRFLDRIGKYRGVNLFDSHTERAKLGCTVLRAVRFWPPERWIPWGAEQQWPKNIVRGRTETNPKRIELLLSAVADEYRQPEDFADEFRLVEADERRIVTAETVQRVGQGAFRARLLDAYGRQCAITGEHTEPVLDAAHIQPYLGEQSNHVQNGLVLTKEFHALFDRGYVTVTPDYEVRVSPRLYSEWNNGHRYRPYDGERLASVPRAAGLRPSREALEWHGQRVFRAT